MFELTGVSRVVDGFVCLDEDVSRVKGQQQHPLYWGITRERHLQIHMLVLCLLTLQILRGELRKVRFREKNKYKKKMRKNSSCHCFSQMVCLFHEGYTGWEKLQVTGERPLINGFTVPSCLWFNYANTLKSPVQTDEHCDRGYGGVYLYWLESVEAISRVECDRGFE